MSPKHLPVTNVEGSTIRRRQTSTCDPQATHPPPPNPTKGEQKSNREAKRLETPATQTKHSIAPSPNREKEAWFSASVGEGVYLPPGLGLGVGCDLGGLRGASDVQDSNREGRRLETGVNLTKQSIQLSSNREKEAWFFGPSRGGCFSPPAVRPRRGRREPHAEIQIHPTQTPEESNRKPKLLQTHVTAEKKRKAHPPFMFRLEMPPILYFLQFARDSNLTMLRLEKRSPTENQNAHAAKRRRKPQGAPLIFVSGRKALDRLFSVSCKEFYLNPCFG